MVERNVSDLYISAGPTWLIGSLRRPNLALLGSIGLNAEAGLGYRKSELLGLAHGSSPFGRGWVRVRKLELHDRRPATVSCFLCIMPHTESTFSDLIGRDCLTPQGDRVTVELY